MEYNIKVALQDIEWVVMDWIRVARDLPLVVGSLEHGNESLGFIKCGEFLELRKC